VRQKPNCTCKLFTAVVKMPIPVADLGWWLWWLNCCGWISYPHIPTQSQSVGYQSVLIVSVTYLLLVVEVAGLVRYMDLRVKLT